MFVSHDERLAARFDARLSLAEINLPTDGGVAARMKALLAIAARSAWNRRGTLALVVLSIALATLLLLGVERMRTDVRESFSQSVSGTDLIVGARTGAVQLMLYAVFRVGGATNNIRMDSVQAIAEAPRRGLGGAAVAGRFAPRLPGAGHHAGLLRALPLRRPRSRWCWRRAGPSRAPGRPVRSGARRRGGAARWATALGQQHHAQPRRRRRMPGAEHADKPFTVVGMLARTGTPVDRTVHIEPARRWRRSTSTGPAARRCRA